MLSSDLNMLQQQLSQRKDSHGGLYLSETFVRLVEFILADCTKIAAEMERHQLAPQRTLIDLSDPKVALLPLAKRPIPVPNRRTDEGDLS